MDLGYHRELSFVEALDQPCLPQRSIFGKGMGGDVSGDFREPFETSAIEHDVMEMPLNVDLGVVNPDALSQHTPSRNLPQGIDQAVALHEALLEQPVRTPLRSAGAVEDERGKNLKRL
jgi:hypothetical protein